MNPNPTSAAMRAVVALLEADATLQALDVTAVYANRAPEDATVPFIIYQLVDSPREYTYKVLVRVGLLVQIKAVDAGGSPVRVRNIDERVDEVLMDAPLTLDAPWRWMGTRRESDLPELPVLDQGTEYVQVGGNYRVTVTK